MDVVALGLAKADAAKRYASGARQASLGTIRQGTLVDDLTTAGQWRTTGTGTVTAGDVSQAAVGMPVSMKVVTGGTGSTLVVESDLFADGYGKFLSFDLLTDATAAAIDVGVMAGTSTYATTSFARSNVLVAGSFGSGSQVFRPGKVIKVTVPVASMGPNGTSAPTDGQIRDIRGWHLGFRDNAVGASTFYLSNFRIHDSQLPPGICWIFDDARYDWVTTALPILEAAGFVSVNAVPTAQVGTTSGQVIGGLPRCTWADLLAAQSRGHQLVSHTQNHTGLTGLTTSQVQAELRGARSDLISHGVDPIGADFLVYPGGAYDATSLPVVKAHHRAARTVISNQASANGPNYETPQVAEMERLKTAYFTSATPATPPSYGTNIIDRLVARGGQAIFTFHTISATAGDMYTYSTADFQTVVNYAASKGMKSYLMSDLWGRV
jgi:peptidoglycan/xylan/chitin deacetylase (PgdA/CDA1 family)